MNLLGLFKLPRGEEGSMQEAHHSSLVDAMMHNAPCGIAFLDRDFRFVQVNTEIERMNRASAKQHLGKFFWDILPGLWTTVAPKLKDVLEKGATHVFEVDSKSFRPVGPRSYFHVSYFPVLSAEKVPIGVGIIVSDITRIKEDDSQLQKLAEDLQRSNKELEQFAYMASHDLKEPLRMISTYLGVYMEKYGSTVEGKGKVYLGYASEGAMRLGRLIDGLLTFSRIGKETAERKLIPIATVVDEAISNLKTLVQECGAEIKCHPLPAATVDRVQMAVLFQNLLANAIKFRRKDAKPEIEIRAEKAEFGLVISVTDNGIGVAEKDRERIFEIFRRVHARTEYPGDGIGLAACRKIIEAHGGNIWVDAAPQGGSTFSFTLPDSLLEPTPASA